MCSPALASLGAQSFGAGMSTVGAFFGAKAQQRQLRADAALADINAGIAENNARHALERGSFEESAIKMKGSQLKSSQVAAYGSNGIDIGGSNSALAVLTGTDLITAIDANRTRANATAAAWGQRIDAGNFRRKAVSGRATAKGISPFLAGATSLIEGAGKVASSWYGMDQQGAFDQPGNANGVNGVQGVIPFSDYAPRVGAHASQSHRFGHAVETTDLLAWGW